MNDLTRNSLTEHLQLLRWNCIKSQEDAAKRVLYGAARSGKRRKLYRLDLFPSSAICASFDSDDTSFYSNEEQDILLDLLGINMMDDDHEQVLNILGDS